jgi:hypothetical protein
MERTFGGIWWKTRIILVILLYSQLKIGDTIPTSIKEQRKICPPIEIPDTTMNSHIILHQREINEYHPMTGCNKRQ